MATQQNDQEQDAVESSSMGLMSHLIELRDRLLRVVIAILLIFLSLFYWANDIYTYLAGPLTRHMPEGSQMIAIDVASPFLTPFKLVLMLSVFLGMPYILYQIWSFVAPGLYKHEKRLAMPLLASSIVLFYCGILFAFYVVFPLVFGFFTSVGPEIVSVSTDIGRYLDFVISLFFGFGLAFEIPIATIILVAMGMMTPVQMAEKRPYVIVGAFVLGMLLTPPDVISQVLLAIPVWLLFETGVLASSYIFADKLRKQAEEEAEQEQANSASGYDKDYDVVDDPVDSNNSAHSEYRPLTDEEMDAEMKRIEEAEYYEDKEPDPKSDSSSSAEGADNDKKTESASDQKNKKIIPPAPDDIGP
ncbi:MAG: twin-arginine translocase subunit TatC [Gammaproteobacteria bacterium]|nr:twin-arginine translocase subunit TatC [Gammaproteobacteria bacterium]